MHYLLEKGTQMSNSSDILGSLLHHLGVAVPARVRASQRSGAPSPTGARGGAVGRLSTPLVPLRARVVPLITFLISFAALLIFTPGTASAALQNPFVGELKVGPLEGRGFKFTNSIAVDGKNGDTVVVGLGFLNETEQGNEEGGSLVRFFNAAGSQVASLDGSNTPGGLFSNTLLNSVAADDSTGNVYVADGRFGAGQHGTVDVFSDTGTFLCQITGTTPVTAPEIGHECNGAAGSATPDGGFGQGEPGAVAVDQATGNVYVFDSVTDVIDVFGPSGAYLSQISGAVVPSHSFGEALSIAVDDRSGELLIACKEREGGKGKQVVWVFEAATGVYLRTWDGSPLSNPPGVPSGSFGEIGGYIAADNVTGDVFLENYEAGVVYELTGAGEYLGQITGVPGETPQPPSFTQVAVNQQTGEVLVTRELSVLSFAGTQVLVPDVTTGAASEAKGTTMTLGGVVSTAGTEPEDALSDCHFDYGTSLSYGQTAPCEPAAAAIPDDGAAHAVQAHLTGLQPGTAYFYRLQAANTSGHPEFGAGIQVQTLPPPSVDSATVANLSASSADLTANINPHGSSTIYRFEYGTSTAYGASVPVPDASIGEGSTAVAVSQRIEGLSPNVTYHWRVVASNEAATTTGIDHTFVYPEVAKALPDRRAYEMVTPVQKNGALVADLPFSIHPDISADGSRVMAETVQCFDGAGLCPPIAGVGVGVPYAFTRTPAGWTPTPLTPPASEFETVGTLDFSAEALTVAFVMPNPVSGERDIYARQADGSFVDVGPITPPEDGPTRTLQLQNTHLEAATADLSHVLFLSLVNRAENILAPFPPTSLHNNLYEYVGAGSTAPLPVGVRGGPESTELINGCSTQLGGEPGPLKTALSADGRIAYFTTGYGCAGEKAVLYARIENGEAGAHTVAVSEPQALEPGPHAECAEAECIKNTAPPATNPNWRDSDYQGASSDGSRVFFTSAQQLTDQASEGSENLYELEGAGAPEPSERRLVDVSAGAKVSGGPRVQGVLAFSSDGSHVYFVAQGVLTGADRPGCKAEWETAGLPEASRCHATEGANNLYVYDADTHSVSFLAALPVRDFNEWQSAGNPANVTPDGRFLVFTSSGLLTADDTRTDGAQQVFRYEAESGRLVRVSVGQAGFNDDGSAGAGDASIVTGRYGYQHLGVGRPDPSMSDDGSYVFFMSPVALTAGALNDVQIGHQGQSNSEIAYAQNVYEYHEGNVSLISDGRDTNSAPGGTCYPDISAVCLIGSDASGHDVFFTTVGQLVPKDTDTEADIYDARICEPENGNPCIAEPASALPPCLGEACHGIPPAPPSALTPGSASFNGPGNLTAAPPVVTKKTVRCKKPKKLSHGRCIKQKPKRKKTKAKKSAHTNRRAK
jgi:Tol biopolymer transport system component